MSDFLKKYPPAIGDGKTPMPDWQLEQLRGWCKNPASEDEYGYDCARYLLGEVDRLRAQVERLRSAIATDRCPRPSNGDPDDITVEQCVKLGHCGCDSGAAFASDDRNG